MEAATLRTCCRVSCFTASGRENALETVDLWTPAAGYVIDAGCGHPFSLVVREVRIPNDGHGRLQIPNPREICKPTVKLLGQLVDESAIQRVAVHVDPGGFGGSVDRCEGCASI